MYCPKCGAPVADGSTFCSSCGSNLAQPPPVYPNYPPYGNPYNPMIYQQKSGGLAAVLAFLIPGAGHLYVGKIARGILFMAAFFSLVVLVPLGNYLIIISTNVNGLDLIWFTLIIGIIAFVVWVFQIVDAYNSAQRYNEALMATGRAPW